METISNGPSLNSFRGRSTPITVMPSVWNCHPESEQNMELETLVDPDFLDDLIQEANEELDRLENLELAPGPETEELPEFPSNAPTTTPNDTVVAHSTFQRTRTGDASGWICR